MWSSMANSVDKHIVPCYNTIYRDISQIAKLRSNNLNRIKIYQEYSLVTYYVTLPIFWGKKQCLIGVHPFEDLVRNQCLMGIDSFEEFGLNGGFKKAT